MEFERIADKKRVHFITDAIIKNVPPGSRILDFGCGNGIISRAIGALGYNVTGIDSSEKTIATAIASNNLPNVHFMVVAAGELSSMHGNYAAIICSEVLEHLPHPGALLKILHELLMNNGILVVTVPNGKGPRELLITRPIQYLQQKNNFAWKLVSSIKNRLGYKGITVQSSAGDLTHLQFYTYSSLKKLSEQHGFRIAVIKKTNFIEQVFPFSIIMKRSRALQQLDCRLADILPKSFTSGFMTIWRKN